MPFAQPPFFPMDPMETPVAGDLISPSVVLTDANGDAPPLRIQLLGGFAVSVRGKPLRKLRTRQGNRLLALLALGNGRELQREALAGQLWINSTSDEGAKASLRRALTDLRDALGTEAARLESPSFTTLRLNLSGGAVCDVHDFDQALVQGTPEALDRALTRYEGPLMPDLDAVHDPNGILRSERERRHYAFLDTLHRRGQLRRSNGAVVLALADFRRLLSADPTRESASRSLMELLGGEGDDRAGALAEYLRLRRVLSRELGAKPEPETRLLYEHIQSSKPGESKGRGATPFPLPRSQAKPSSTDAATPPTGPITLFFASLTDSDDGSNGTAARNMQMRLRQVIDANEGILYAAQADQRLYQAVFALPSDALAAAVDLTGEDAPRLHIALHTGIAAFAEGSYSGSLVEATNALVAAGHPGQILLSGVTADILRDLLPDEWSLRDLGSHRFRSGEQPSDRVYQLTQAGRSENYPPLRSLVTVPSNLPIYLTRFIGRQAAVGTVRDLLRTNRLLTLTGAGGVGKTRMAQQVAADALDEYQDGVWQVELAPLPASADAVPIVQAVASALKVKEKPQQYMVETLIAFLHDKRLLLLLDNGEHLIPVCSNVITRLLGACPRLTILATSREPFALLGEQIYRVPSLAVPDARQKKTPFTAESIALYDAVRLFADRAVLAKPDFTVTNKNASIVARVCHLLDGIPLAIELAAARTRAVPLEPLLERLEDRFPVLTGGDKTTVPRQQTLRALVDWSYDLLSEQEKTLFARLSVFVGGWTLDAAEFVGASQSSAPGTASLSAADVLDLLTSLVDKSLVLVDEDTNAGTGRYRMLETLRQYATEKAKANNETDCLIERHRNFFVRLAEEAMTKITGPEQGQWLNRLETEHDNMRAALDRCAAPAADNQTAVLMGLRLAGALRRFWEVRGYGSEGRRRLACALKAQQNLTGEGGTEEVVMAMKRAVARACSAAGILASDQGDFVAAQSQYAESLSLYRSIGDERGIAGVLNSLGIVASHERDFVAARTHYEESLGLYRGLEDRSSIASMLNNLGILAQNQGDYALAQAHYEESLTIHRTLGDKRFIAGTLNGLGSVAASQGDYATARARHEESLMLDWEIGNKWSSAYGLRGLAVSVWANGAGDARQAIILWAAATSLREATGSQLLPTDRANQDRQVAQARAELGEAKFTASWAEGISLSWEQAIVYALGE